jgi:hypothetical protein
MDSLSLLLHRFPLSAGVFYLGQICGIHDFVRDAQRGNVHPTHWLSQASEARSSAI